MSAVGQPSDLDSTNEFALDPRESESPWESADDEMDSEYIPGLNDEPEDEDVDDSDGEYQPDDNDEDLDNEQENEADESEGFQEDYDNGWNRIFLRYLHTGGEPMVFAGLTAASSSTSDGIFLGNLRRLTWSRDYDTVEARSRTRAFDPRTAPSTPSDKSLELVDSGLFGNNDRRSARILQAKRLGRRVLERELGGSHYGREKVETPLAKHNLVPESRPDLVIEYRTKQYMGQFSPDGSIFFSGGNDLKVRMYDTSNPYKWKFYKGVTTQAGHGSILDASLSADNKWLAFCNRSTVISLTTSDPFDKSEPLALDISRMLPDSYASRRRPREDYYMVFSLRFSGDGKEIVAGTSDESIIVYDIERRGAVLRIHGHDDDVNAVCYGDPNSPHILYSGSDDGTLKVWDRRSIGDGRPAGVFLGHSQGLTYIDSKNDGRYVLTNAKDQTAKLWDLRKVMSTDKAKRLRPATFIGNWDYRSTLKDLEPMKQHPHDSSVVTFRGHTVRITLIRAHFSPAGSTDGQFVYAGSQDGKVYIWNLDSTLRTTLDVKEATRYLRNRPKEPSYYYGSDFQTVIRDASWHPAAPVIAATAWNGWGASLGTCTVHSWNDGVDEEDPFEEKPIVTGAELESPISETGRSYRRWRRY